LSWARKNGGKVATGHYAQNINNQLIKGIDNTKDQSYFLWTLTNDQMKDILFPIGHLQKSEVRKLAEKYKLPTATKKDSQGICFIGEVDMKEFLAHYIEPKEGNVLNESGKIIGKHNGALFHTLGERHGFTITEKTPDDKPYYVIAKDIDSNTITVSQHPKEIALNKTFTLSDCVWRTEVTDKKYTANIRYHGEMKSCTINGDQITFDEPDFSLSIGQSVVVYDGEICIGGGILSA
jgi:tRNA-specific 2-thiouridylase